MSLYLESCIWPDAILGWIQRQVCITFCANIRKIRQRSWQWLDKCLGKKSMSHTRMFEWLAHYFLHHEDCSQRICTGRPNSQYCILLWCCTPTAWNAPNFGDKRTGCCIMITNYLTLLFFTREFLIKNHDYCPLTHLTFLCFPDWRYNWTAAILTQLWWRKNCRWSWTPTQNNL
jgi:hypothetical protein